MVASGASGSSSKARRTRTASSRRSALCGTEVRAWGSQEVEQAPQPVQVSGSTDRVSSSPVPFFCCSASSNQAAAATSGRSARGELMARAAAWAAVLVASSRLALSMAVRAAPASRLAASGSEASARPLTSRTIALAIAPERRRSAPGSVPLATASAVAVSSKARGVKEATPMAPSGQADQQAPQPVQASGSRAGRTERAVERSAKAEVIGGTAATARAGSTEIRSVRPSR